MPKDLFEKNDKDNKKTTTTSVPFSSEEDSMIHGVPAAVSR